VIPLSTWVYEHLEMSTICLDMLLELPHIQMPGWWGVYSLPHNSSRWTEKLMLLSSGTLGNPMPWPRQPTVRVYSSRPLPKQFDAHRTVRCHSPRAPICGPLCTDCLVSHLVHTGQVLFTVQCATRVLADCPVRGFFSLFLLGLFCS
jgi:hypothetical protein